MITAELQGKLGNMMFQIAAIEHMGYKSGIQTAYPNVNANIEALRKPQACSSETRGHEYFKLFKNFNWHKNQDGDTHNDNTVNVPFHYVHIEPRDYTRYIGYFQSELYFHDRDFVLELFKPADFIQEALLKYKEIIGENRAAIHVRRGDYIKLNHIYNVLDMDYYNKAMSFLSELGVSEYLVFSNDKQWCEQNFRGYQFIHMDEDPFTELFLMGRCKHQIIANSAFSWWGAYLNNDPDRMVIAPAKWFSSRAHNSKDIVPLKWIKL